jgi:DNA polymerase epsilon subunit 3
VPDDNETSKSTIAVAATATATATAAGARNGNRTDQEPPSKKIRREAGGEEDVSEDEEFHDAMENEDEEVVEGDEEEDEDEEVEDEDEDEDEDDEEDERAVGNGLRDEALDDASEDSD